MYIGISVIILEKYGMVTFWKQQQKRFDQVKPVHTVTSLLFAGLQEAKFHVIVPHHVEKNNCYVENKSCSVV